MFPPPTHTLGQAADCFSSKTSLECVPFLYITFPQHHKINCTMECFNFLLSLESHANKTFGEKEKLPSKWQ